MSERPDLSSLSHDEKDTLIRALWAQVQALTIRVSELEAKLGGPPKTPDNSSMPPSQGKKPNRADQATRDGPRKGSLGRAGGGRALGSVATGPPRSTRLMPAIHAKPCGSPCRWAVRLIFVVTDGPAAYFPPPVYMSPMPAPVFSPGPSLVMNRIKRVNRLRPGKPFGETQAQLSPECPT